MTHLGVKARIGTLLARDVIIAGEVVQESGTRSPDLRPLRWLRLLAELRDMGQISPQEFEDLCCWAAEEDLSEEASLEERARVLERRPDIGRRLLFEGEVSSATLGRLLIDTPTEARRRQILTAIRLNRKPRILCLGMTFVLVPPGCWRGDLDNAGAFWLGETLVTERVWAEILDGKETSEDPGKRKDRTRVGIPRWQIDRFVRTAQQYLGSQGELALPNSAKLSFARALGGGSAAGTHLGFQGFSGGILQLCRDEEGWRWWGESVPRGLPSFSSMESGPTHGFRPVLYLDDMDAAITSPRTGRLK